MLLFPIDVDLEGGEQGPIAVSEGVRVLHLYTNLLWITDAKAYMLNAYTPDYFYIPLLF